MLIYLHQGGAITADPGALEGAFRASSPLRQFSAIFAAFGIKPVYMTLSLLVPWWLRGRSEPDLKATSRAMLAFFLGETFCYVNIFVYHHESGLSEYLHSYGMVVALGFAAYAFLEALDRRVLFTEDQSRSCNLIGLCGGCSRSAEPGCCFVRVFQFVIPACLILAGLPLMVEPSVVSYHTIIWRFPYNYSHALVHQLFELRICPLFAAPLFAASWLALLKRWRSLAWSKVLFSMGMGFLLFGYLRLLLLAPFRDDLVWFDFWEEATELLGVAAVAILIRIFKKGLLVVELPG